jgi:hypothetical protein
MKKYEDKIHQLELEVHAYENELRMAEQTKISILRDKYEIAEKLHLVLYYLTLNQALAAVKWANQVQKSGGILLPKALQYSLPKELEKEISK